jgi:hypothetical protein
MPARLILLTLVAALFVTALAPAAGASPADPMAAAAAKQKKKQQKRKAVKCRRSQVNIKVGKRTVGCRSLRAALPAPRDGDARSLLVQSALDDLGGLRDRRGRRAPSLKKLCRKLGPRAYRTVQRAIPQVLARLDRLAATPAKTARSVAVPAQAPACAGGSGPTKRDSYRSSSGGQKMTATVTLGAVGKLDLSVEGGGYEISVSVSTDDCSRFEAPRCPTAAGVVDATDASALSLSLAVAKGDTVLMSKSVDFSGRTRMHAEVGVDAKLDFIDIDDTQTANIHLGGAKQQFGPVNLIYTGIHHARVQMPGGGYQPDLSAVDISLTAQGVTVGRSALGQVGNNIAADLDKSFATLVGKEIANFRNLENGWAVENACVDLQSNPASRSLKLRAGQHGSVSVQAVAEHGGGSSQGHWTLGSQQNASFAPASADGTGPSFSYGVTDAGQGLVVSVVIRVTSRAGVGKTTWEQETENDELARYIGTVSGTISEATTDPACGMRAEWSYSASLRDYSGESESFVVGADSGARPYNETGGGEYENFPCEDAESPGCVTGLAPDPTGEGMVLFEVDGGVVKAEVIASYFNSTNDACGRLSFQRTLGIGTIPLSMVGAPTITVSLSYENDDSGTRRRGTGTLTLTRAG